MDNQENNVNNNDLVHEAIKSGAVPDIPEGYKEIDISFFQFKSPGDRLEGKLTRKSKIQIRPGQDVGKYSILNTKTGSVHTFLGTVQLDELLNTIPVNSYILIIYTRDETLESGFTMKRFSVYQKLTQ